MPQSPLDRTKSTLDRRRVLQGLALSGTGMAVFGRALASLAQQHGRVTAEMIRQAEWISGLEFTDADRELMLEDTQELIDGFERLRRVPLDNQIAPALYFHLHGMREARTADPPSRDASWLEQPTPPRLASEEELAFATVRELGALLRSGEITSLELTRLYLDRLERLDPVVRCVITLTEELALEQAERADREFAQGHDRGPLHGIPWGAKDLLAVPGYPTTWGATPYRHQTRQETATVVSRLNQAGAVLTAKLSVGALAWGDVWFDAKTRNPWKPEQGSSGSSAGSAAATAAGLTAFAIGTETWGSIVSPCTRCGVTGLRPTFGRVSRFGAMALSWSMDKIGPIARTVEDCAVIFDAIHGADGADPTALDRVFRWPPSRHAADLRIGYPVSLFDRERTADIEDDEGSQAIAKQRQREWQEIDLETLEVLRELGVRLEPMELPESLPIEDLGLILTAEATAAFDELTRSGRDDLLVRQVRDAWPNTFRQGQLIPAVEYIRANRIRSLLMAEMERTLGDLDGWVCPSFVGDNLLLTNLTGHPCVVLPNGFDSAGLPTSITFMGRLFGEEAVLALAHAYQQATRFHLGRPLLAP